MEFKFKKILKVMHSCVICGLPSTLPGIKLFGINFCGCRACQEHFRQGIYWNLIRIRS